MYSVGGLVCVRETSESGCVAACVGTPGVDTEAGRLQQPAPEDPVVAGIAEYRSLAINIVQ